MTFVDEVAITIINIYYYSFVIILAKENWFTMLHCLVTNDCFS